MSQPALTEQVAAVRDAAALFRLPGRAVIEVGGSERVRWLDGMVTNDVSALDAAGVGAGCFALLLTPQGRIVADLHVLALPEVLWLELEASALERVSRALERFIIADDVTLRELSGEVARLSLEGPAAGAVLAEVAPDFEPPATDAWVATEVAGRALRVAAYGFCGVPALQLFCAASDAERVAGALLEGGGGLGLLAAEPDALELLRVEAGTPWHGRELDESVLPAEARLERAVSETKGCYTGQEVVARLRSRGRVNHLLVGLRFGGSAPAGPGTALRADAREVGEVTSVVDSPGHGAIGLGFVRHEFAGPGTELRVGEGSVTVEQLPFPPPRS